MTHLKFPGPTFKACRKYG